jgi:hypothetical protein
VEEAVAGLTIEHEGSEELEKPGHPRMPPVELCGGDSICPGSVVWPQIPGDKKRGRFRAYIQGTLRANIQGTLRANIERILRTNIEAILRASIETKLEAYIETI